MEKTNYIRLRGSRNFRQRLLLSTLSRRPIIIDNIRENGSPVGLSHPEASLLRLFDRVTDGCKVEINPTGTRLKYKPGVVIGGKNHVHDCDVGQSISYYLEPLIVLALFGSKPLLIKLRGVTNDPKDPSIDTFRHTTLHILQRFGVPKEGLILKVESRGAPPLGGGEIILGVPILHNSLSAVNWVDEGLVKRIRGVTFTTKVSPEFDHRMMYAARGLLNPFLPDVRIEKDHRSGPSAGRSNGYGISLFAETDSGCFLSADYAVCRRKVDEMENSEDSDQNPVLMPPEELGVKVASMLLEEIYQHGVVDSTHQGLLFLLCALGPRDISKVRVGKLTPYGIETLRTIKEILDIKFVFEPDPVTDTVVLKCMGMGLKNFSRSIS
ncbi:putative RNA 3'-terminal phosphate cyclase-like protein [Iris pallida]|uniref:RNA 3'-terminal phosphate cyclase-like protein n=1 Tax=Iris pallida TaxID=29817 RepID=A0AAX6DV78_IRIPA|nr:putative RNA 3'-terminal phosphate cyclase-like protein [Iris pallida]KAJ6810296.1 putative RNA 3'-terminal phosphate cyclase-like protein [Iris pallida]